MNITSPAVGEDGRLYVLARRAATLTLDALTSRGEPLWSCPLEPGFRAASVPSIGPDSVLCVGFARSGDGPGALEAIDARTGRKIWSRPTPSSVAGSPVRTAEGLLLISCRDGTLNALDAATGEPRWTLPIGTSGLTAPAVGRENRVYLGDQGGRLYAVE